MKSIPVRLLLSSILAAAGLGLVGCEGEETPIDEVPGPAGPAETPEVPPGYETEETGPGGPVETPEVPPAE